MREDTFVKFLLHFYIIFNMQEFVVIFEHFDDCAADCTFSWLDVKNDKDVFDSFKFVIHVS